MIVAGGSGGLAGHQDGPGPLGFDKDVHRMVQVKIITPTSFLLACFLGSHACGSLVSHLGSQLHDVKLGQPGQVLGARAGRLFFPQGVGGGLGPY